MSSSWDPLTLAFSNEELESHYTDYLATSTFLAVDRAFAYFGLTSSALLTCLSLFGVHAASFSVTAIVNGLCGFSVIALQRNGRSWFLKHRTLVILILRNIRCAGSVYAYIRLPPDGPEFPQLGRCILFGCIWIVWACGMPLKFKVKPSNK